MEELKIGEIRQVNGEWYQCLESSSCRCDYCDYGELGDCHKIACASGERSDDKEVYFKKLKKVGLPYYNSNNKLYQQYKCYIVPLITNEIVDAFADNRVVIEVKQNKKEKMEEKKIQLKQEDIDYLIRKIRYLVDKTHDYDGVSEEIQKLFIPIKHSNSENIGKILKPFDLEAAKAGKPVCTRDGRKARIICFDRKFYHDGYNYPIVAMVNDNDNELVHAYTQDGLLVGKGECESDLMMLPEKKEGWINIYNADTTFYYVDGRVFETKDEAVKEAKEEVEKEQREKNEYIDTIRVEWEE